MSSTDLADPAPSAAPRPTHPGRWLGGFLVTFGLAWAALDRLVVSPPLPGNALICLAAAGAILVVGEVGLLGAPLSTVARRLGLGRPSPAAVLVGSGVGLLAVVVDVVGAALLGHSLQLRSDWPLVLLGVVLFHGLAEELVWRGFVFGELRRHLTYRRALLASIPLLALTHVPIMVTTGVGVGLAAVLTAAVICVPMARLWERGGRTIWGPAALHAGVGCWQLFARTYPIEMSVLFAASTTLVPLVILAWSRRDPGDRRLVR